VNQIQSRGDCVEKGFHRSCVSIALGAMLILSLLVVVATDDASAEEEGGYVYSLGGSPTVATITGYYGLDGSITTPATRGGYPVVAIGVWAFAFSSLITSVNIRTGVTSIDAGAFYSCTSLSQVTIPASVNTIDEYAFELCTSLTSINFLGSNRPYTGTGWINATYGGLTGHAYAGSDFPPPGGNFDGLPMGDEISGVPFNDDLMPAIWLVLIVIVLSAVALFLLYVHRNQKAYPPHQSQPDQWSVKEQRSGDQRSSQEIDRQHTPPNNAQYGRPRPPGRTIAYCPWCGTPTSGAPFCGYCGGKLEK